MGLKQVNGPQMPMLMPMVHLPVQDPSRQLHPIFPSSLPLKRGPSSLSSLHQCPPPTYFPHSHLSLLQGKNYPTMSNHPPSLPHSLAAIQTPRRHLLWLRELRGIRHIARGSGAQEDREGPKESWQTCRATPGVHTCFHLGISTRRSSVPGGSSGAAARAQVP